jgi:hypothetical protein
MSSSLEASELFSHPAHLSCPSKIARLRVEPILKAGILPSLISLGKPWTGGLAAGLLTSFTVRTLGSLATGLCGGFYSQFHKAPPSFTHPMPRGNVRTFDDPI